MTESTRFCTSCGGAIANGGPFCPDCGARQDPLPSAAPTASRPAATTSAGAPLVAPTLPASSSGQQPTAADRPVGAQQGTTASVSTAANNAMASLAPPMPAATTQLVISERESAYRAGGFGKAMGAFLLGLAAVALVLGMILAVIVVSMGSEYSVLSDSAVLGGVIVASLTVYTSAILSGFGAALRAIGSYTTWRSVSDAADRAARAGEGAQVG